MTTMLIDNSDNRQLFLMHLSVVKGDKAPVNVIPQGEGEREKADPGVFDIFIQAKVIFPSSWT